MEFSGGRKQDWLRPMAVAAAAGFLCLALSSLLRVIHEWSLLFPHRGYTRTAGLLAVSSWAFLAGSTFAAGWQRWSAAAWLAAAGFTCSALAQIVIDVRLFPSATDFRVSDVLQAMGWAVLAAAVLAGRWRARGV